MADHISTQKKSIEDATPDTGVDLDLLLERELGQFGLYQLRTLALGCLVVIFASWATNQYVFTTARISTRCLIPECESPDYQKFTPSWILNAIPGASNSSFDNCHRFQNLSSTLATFNENDTCPATYFAQETVIPCDDYVYENKDTVVYDFNLACDEWRRSLIGSIRTIGILVSQPITGYVSDRWGRQTAMAISAFNTAWLGVIRYWTNTYIGFTISQFSDAAFGFGSFSCAYLLGLEIVGPKYRVAACATMSSFFAIGEFSIALIAWGVPNWRLLTLALYIPQFITITYFWITSESIRWYLSKGFYDKFEKAVNEAARINGKHISEKSMMSIKQAIEERKNKVAQLDEAKEPWLILQVFRNKPILLRCIVTPVWWISTMCVYYGLSVNAVNMVGNKYLNFMAISLVEIPGFWTPVLLMNRIGRKPVLIGAFWVCAISLLGFTFMPNNAPGLYWLSLTLYMIGKYSISAVMISMHVYTAELYPTRFRHSLLAFSSMTGRLGSIFAPLTPALAVAVWEGLPFVLFAGLAILSGLLVLVTPETLGSKLPDTMEEAARIGTTKNIQRDVFVLSISKEVEDQAASYKQQKNDTGL